MAGWAQNYKLMTSPHSEPDEILISRLRDQWLESGSTHPDEQLYYSAEVFALEIRRIFFANWTLFDFASRFEEDAHCRLHNIAMRSYIVVRNAANSFHALRNRCLHAAHPVLIADRSDSGDSLVCAYHGWRYSLGGELVSAPHLRTEISRDMTLPKQDVALHAGLLYMAPVSELFTSPVPEFLTYQDFADGASYSQSSQYDIAANWKKLARLVRRCTKNIFIAHNPHIEHSVGCDLLLTHDAGSAIIRLIPWSVDRTKLTITQQLSYDLNQAQQEEFARHADHLHAELERLALSGETGDADTQAQFRQRYLAMLTTVEYKETH